MTQIVKKLPDTGASVRRKCPTCGGKHNPKLSCLKAWLRDVRNGK